MNNVSTPHGLLCPFSQRKCDVCSPIGLLVSTPNGLLCPFCQAEEQKTRIICESFNPSRAPLSISP
jgi:hypothetical protein